MAAHDADAFPAPRTSARADLYVTLRAADAPDSLSPLPPALRDAARRLQSLTEFLPDSLALRTPENTVLIMYRKNPRHRAHVERLLWRRLDPALASLGESDDLPRVLDRLASDLSPLCGPRADSIRVGLSKLLASALPVFRNTLWPARERANLAFAESVRSGPSGEGRGVLSGLSRTLAMPLPDTTKFRMLVLSGRPPERIPPVRTEDGSAVLLACSDGPLDPDGWIELLREYLGIAEALSPGNAETAPRILGGALSEMGAPPDLRARISGAFLDYAIAKTLETALGWGRTRPLADGSPYADVLRKNWNAYLAGGISLDTACRAIASEAGGPRN